MKRILEIACFNLESCLIAQNSGADRIEFCNNYSKGGITPSREEIVQARQLIKIPLFIMIRPRGGNFVFTNEEKEKMKADTLFCKEQKVDGIVTGALTAQSTIDEDLLKELLVLASPVPFTFHRAFDDCTSTTEAAKTLIKLGVRRILSSGKATTASEGAQKLKELKESFDAYITIMPGGGIRSDSISELMNSTGCNEFHTSAITAGFEVANPDEIRKIKSIFNHNFI